MYLFESKCETIIDVKRIARLKWLLTNNNYDYESINGFGSWEKNC